MVSRRTRVASWIFRRDHPSRPNAMICCFFSSFKTFAILREATYPPAAVNVLNVSSESMAAFQVFMYGRFWVFTEAFLARSHSSTCPKKPPNIVDSSSCGLVAVSSKNSRENLICFFFPPLPPIPQTSGSSPQKHFHPHFPTHTPLPHDLLH